jgi:hypothetical protein
MGKRKKERRILRDNVFRKLGFGLYYKIAVKNAEDPTRVSFENKLYTLIKNGDVKEAETPKYRLVAQPQGRLLTTSRSLFPAA